jgi:hypothetical protein
MTEILDAMTAPTVDGQPSLPRRAGAKGLLPSTWLYPAGPVRGIGTTKTLISWKRLVLCELVND